MFFYLVPKSKESLTGFNFSLKKNPTGVVLAHYNVCENHRKLFFKKKKITYTDSQHTHTISASQNASHAFSTLFHKLEQFLDNCSFPSPCPNANAFPPFSFTFRAVTTMALIQTKGVHLTMQFLWWKHVSISGRGYDFGHFSLQYRPSCCPLYFFWISTQKVSGSKIQGF